MSSNLSPLAVTFDLRFRKAWSLCYEDKREEAETAAAELLLEPRLGPFHQAGMHLLLAMSPDDYVEHALEAVRLYDEIDTPGLSEFEKYHLAKLKKDANNVLNKARQDKTGVDREIRKMLARGMTMDELRDAQINEMHKRLDAKEEDTDVGDDLSESQDVADMTEDSQTETQRTESQRTESQRTESQRMESQTTVFGSRSASIADSQKTVTDYLDDDEPLPDIVRYKFDE